MTTTEKINHERINHGVEYLTQEHGDGWWANINPETLNIQSMFRCVVGQLHGKLRSPSYREYCADKGYEWLAERGFTSFNTCDFPELTKLWKVKIEELAHSA